MSRFGANISLGTVLNKLTGTGRGFITVRKLHLFSFFDFAAFFTLASSPSITISCLYPAKESEIQV